MTRLSGNYVVFLDFTDSFLKVWINELILCKLRNMEVPSEIMIRYIERRKRDLEECLSSLRKHSYEDIERVGHQLKGNGATFGHPELSTIGKKLEQAAQVQDLENLEIALKEFSQWVHALH